MLSRRSNRHRLRFAILLRPWVIAAGAGLVLGAALLSIDGGEPGHALAEFGAGESAAESFRPSEEAMIRAEAEFRDPFAPTTAPGLSSASAGLADTGEARLSLQPSSATAETPGSGR